MNFNHNAYTSAQQEELARKIKLIEDTSVFLAQVGALLKSRPFHAWLKERPCRFTWATEELYSRLDRDLSFQVGQALPQPRREQPQDLGDRLKQLGTLCVELSDDLIQRFALKLTKKERKIPLTEEFLFNNFLYSWLSHRPLNRLAKDEGNGFYIWNALNMLINYVRARETLQRDTGNAQFEKILNGVTLDYLLSGYPFDLLSHDAHDVRRGVSVKALVLRNSYCSTYIVQENESLKTPYGDDCKVVYLNKSAA